MDPLPPDEPEEADTPDGDPDASAGESAVGQGPAVKKFDIESLAQAVTAEGVEGLEMLKGRAGFGTACKALLMYHIVDGVKPFTDTQPRVEEAEVRSHIGRRTDPATRRLTLAHHHPLPAQLPRPQLIMFDPPWGVLGHRPESAAAGGGGDGGGTADRGDRALSRAELRKLAKYCFKVCSSCAFTP